MSRLLNQYAKAVAALRGILASPYGCTLCDSGVPRNLDKGHQPWCPYEKARAVIAEEEAVGNLASTPLDTKIADSVAEMRGKDIGILIHDDGVVRLQWPEKDGSLPPDMTRTTIKDARYDADHQRVDLDLYTSRTVFFTCSFVVGDIYQGEHQ